MAQRRSTGSGALLLKRFGLTGAKPALIAALVLVLGAAGLGAARQLSPQSLQIERASAGEKVEDSSEQAATTEESTAAAQASEQEEVVPELSRCIVHVDGAVNAAGVLELEGSDLRVGDAVGRAGGLAEDADTSSINLAEPLVDGAKIYIPHVGETPSVPAATQQVGGESANPGTPSAAASGLININSASSEELQSLSGVGEATASAIIEDRTNNGPFTSVDDLMRVSGIGEKKLARIREHICV